MEKGNIVKHAYRKRNLYLVVNADNPQEVLITKVKKGKGYPLAEDDILYKAPLNQLKVIDYEPAYKKVETYNLSLVRREQDKAKEGDYSQVPEEIHRKFLGIAGSLSPENLACDGELPRAEAQKRLKSLQKQWKELEKSLGFKVSEDSVWNRELKIRKVL